MKKLLCLLIGCFIMLVTSVAFAGTESITFAWEKSIIEVDLAKFELQYTVDNPSVEDSVTPEEERTWEHLVDVPYVTDQTSPFTEQAVLTSPDGERVQYWFRISAVDTSGNASNWNYGSATEPNCNAWIDFEEPGATIEFTVTVNVEPDPS